MVAFGLRGLLVVYGQRHHHLPPPHTHPPSRCKELNVPILEELVRLRHRIATLCGYASHAAYRLKKRMAKTPSNVKNFLEDLNYKLSPLADRELGVLLKYKAAEVREKGLKEEDPNVLHMYDYRYYLNQVEEFDYQVDHEALRQYVGWWGWVGVTGWTTASTSISSHHPHMFARPDTSHWMRCWAA